MCLTVKTTCLCHYTCMLYHFGHRGQSSRNISCHLGLLTSHYACVTHHLGHMGQTFSSREAALLLVSTKNRDLARSNTGSPWFTDFVTLRMLRVKCDKFDWFWSQSIVFTKPFITGRHGSAPRSMGVISPNRRVTRVTRTWYLRLLRVRVRVTWSQDNVIRVNMLIRVPSRHVTTHASSNMRIMEAR